MPRILIIEDTPEIAEALQQHLQRRGHTVSIATRASQAMALVASEQPELVILDLGLPDRDGYSVLEQLRARGLHMPVLILSGRREEEDKIKGFQIGADDYVTKPFGALELLARVDALLRRSSGTSATAATAATAGTASAKPLGTLPDDDTLRRRFGLTDRQVAVTRLLGEGCSNEEIAARLSITENTARNHTYHVMTKLGITKRARIGVFLRTPLM